MRTKYISRHVAAGWLIGLFVAGLSLSACGGAVDSASGGSAPVAQTEEAMATATTATENQEAAAQTEATAAGNENSQAPSDQQVLPSVTQRLLKMTR